MSAETPRKILLVQLYRIGDALLTTPAARALKAAFPQARVDFLCENPALQILQDHPDIDEAVFYDRMRPAGMIRDVRRRGYDWVIDFLGTPRTAVLTALSGAPVRAGSERVFHRWAYNRRLKQPLKPCYVGLEKMLMLETLGVKPVKDIFPRLGISQAYSDFAAEFYAKSGISPGDTVVTISPVSRRHFNRWFLDRYAGLCTWLSERFKARTVVLWGPGERAQAQSVVEQAGGSPLLGPETRSLMDLAALAARADLHIGNDNGVKHVAAAAGAPTFTIFGPHSPVSWTPPEPSRHRFIQKDCLCRGDGARKHSCPDLRCLDDVSLDEVKRQVAPFFSEILAAKTHGAAK